MRHTTPTSMAWRTLLWCIGFLSLVATAHAAPDLYFKSITVSASKRFDGLVGVSGSLITANYVVASTGGNVTTDFSIRIYLCPTKGTSGCINAFRNDNYLRNTVTASGLKIKQTAGFPTNTLPGPQFIRVALDATKRVAESNENNNDFYQALNVTCKPDMASAFSVGVSRLTPGQKLAVTYYLNNTGCAHAQNVRTGIYWSRDGRWDSSDTLLGFGTASQVVDYSRGGKHTITITTPSVMSHYGHGYLLSVADDNKKIPELKETNNVSSARRFFVNDPRPDLSVTVGPSSLVVSKDGPVRISIAIANTGLQDAKSFVVSIKGVGVQSTFTVPGIKAQSRYSNNINLQLKMSNYRSGGVYPLTITVDANAQISEKNESNNTARVTLYPRATTDMVLQNVKLSPTTQAPGGTVTASADVLNNSFFASASFNFELYYSNVNFANYGQFIRDRRKVLLRRQGVGAGSHKAKEKKSYSAIGKIPSTYKAGPIYFYVFVNVLADTNINDNWVKLTATVSKPRPDLTPTVLNAPTSVIAGKKLIVSYTIKNQGKVNAGAYRVGLYASTDATITTRDTQLSFASQPGLATGKSYNGSFSLTTSRSLSPNFKYIGLIVDAGSQITESDETNNTKNKAIKILSDLDGDGVTSDKDCNDKDKTVYPGAKELCDNKDNNCNKQIDESLSQVCYGGPANTKGKGPCKAGTQVCKAGQWQNCVGQVLPKMETCNGQDDDCDGKIDDGVRVSLSCPPGTRKGDCAIGRGVCQSGKAVCVYNRPTTERCDKRDNDCNGKIDDNPACQPAQDCYTKGCPKGQLCLTGKCMPNPCATVRCSADAYCLLGRCIKRCGCKACGAEEICVNGQCQRNKCIPQGGGGKVQPPCPPGYGCNKVTGCFRKQCTSQGCGPKRACIMGRCQDDPCLYVSCGSGYKCDQGQCRRTACNQEAKTEAVTEAVVEPKTEQIAEATVDAGTTKDSATPDLAPADTSQTDAGRPDTTPIDDTPQDTNKPDTSAAPDAETQEKTAQPEAATSSDKGSTADSEPPPAGGCQCNLRQSTPPLWMGFVLVCLGLLLRRKRSFREASPPAHHHRK